MSASFFSHDLLRLNARDSRRRASRFNAATGDAVVIRSAGTGDRELLDLLAALDSAPRLTGEVLIAEVAGEARAAIELGSGRTVADPFHPSTHLQELLAVRARYFAGLGPARVA